MMFLGLVILVRNTLRIRNRTLRNFRNDHNMSESSYKEMAFVGGSTTYSSYELSKNLSTLETTFSKGVPLMSRGGN
jgi:hypothetical protein